MRDRKKLLLGLAPTRRFVFSAEDAARYKVLVEQKLKQWNVEFVNIDTVNAEGLLYERKHAAAAAELFKKAGVDAVFSPHVNFGTARSASPSCSGDRATRRRCPTVIGCATRSAACSPRRTC